MRNGPVVRHRIKALRSNDGAPPPLRLLASSRPSHGSAHAAKIGSGFAHGACVRLESSLPLNLKAFLIQELGPTLRIEDNAIYSQIPGLGETFMQELARAIRRFSFNRSRERWIEYQVPVERLDELLGVALSEGREVLLCLSCATLSSSCAGCPDHSAPQCVTFKLGADMSNAAGDAASYIRVLVHHGLYGMIEGFRSSRAAQNLSHFDLDYYVRNGLVVFTWRPLSRE